VEKMRGNENSKAAILVRNLASPILLQIFGLLASTHGCPFTVQGQPRQIIPFEHFTHGTSLSNPTHSSHISLLFIRFQSFETTQILPR